MLPIRRHTKLLLLTGLFAILGVCVFSFVYARYVVYARYDSAIVFSHPSGYYAEPFDLKIQTGGAYAIYYTLDGSEPTVHSQRYDSGAGIHLEDVSGKENVYSARTDLSTGYDTELVNQYSEQNYGYAAPEFPVDKCSVVRAASFDRDGNALASMTGVYFIGFQNKPMYRDLYTVSITADPDGLFGYEEGILVTGKTFDDYVEASRTQDGVVFTGKDAPNWWWWPANYRNTGEKWERKAHIAVFDQSRQLVLDQDCGIRVHGGGSRGYAQKSIRCIARREYSGMGTFPVTWFGEGITPSKFVLFSGGDDSIFKMRDCIAQELAKDLNFATMEFIPCCVFINGEFWGFYFITENYNENFISDHYGVKEDNVIMVKDGEASGAAGGINLYWEMCRFISEYDMTEESNYRLASEMIDMDSCIDYYAFQIYYARKVDWPGGNKAFWRTSEPENSLYGDCRWRWMLFDLNSGGAKEDALEDDSLAYVLERDALFRSLFQNRQFRRAFSERILEIGNTVLDRKTCADFIDGFDATFREPIRQNSLRFFNDGKQQEYEAYLDGMRLFFAERYEIVVQFLSAHLAEYGESIPDFLPSQP